MKKNGLFRYLERVAQNKGQLIFLITAFTFYLTILSIVFGVSSNIIDEYLKTDTNQHYEFRKIEDLVRFPIEQYDLLNKSANDARKLDLSKEDYLTKEFRVIDLTVTEFDNRIHNDLQSLLLKCDLGGKLGKQYLVRNIEKSKSLLATEVAIRQGYLERKVNVGFPEFALYYMLPICDEANNAVLVKSDLDQKRPKDELYSELLTETQNIWVNNPTCQPRITASRFDLMIEKLSGEIMKEDKNSEIIVTILSDFDAEAEPDSVQKDESILKSFRDLMASLKKTNSDIKFNLIKVPSRKKRIDEGSDMSEEVISVIQDNFPESTNELELSKALSFESLIKPSSSFWDKESTITIDLLRGRLKKGLEPGYYAFSLKNADPSNQLNLIYESRKYPITFEDLFIKVEANNRIVELEYIGDNPHDFIGDLKVSSIRELNTKTYSLWRKRVLNESTIGFIVVGFVSLAYISICVIYVLIKEIYHFRRINIGLLNKRWIFNFTKIWRNLINKIIYLGAVVFFVYRFIESKEYLNSFYFHVIDYDKHLKYWEPYLGLVGVTIVFIGIRIYEKKFHQNKQMESCLDNLKEEKFLYFPTAVKGSIFPRTCHPAELSEAYYKASLNGEGIKGGLKLELFNNEENQDEEPEKHKRLQAKQKLRVCEFDTETNGKLKQARSGKVEFQNGAWVVIEKIELQSSN